MLKRRYGMLTASLATFILGCQQGAPPSSSGWEVLRSEVEHRRYTLVRVGDGNFVKEVQDMFNYKGAYFWLIDAVESEDPNVVRTSKAFFAASGTPGDISRSALHGWYESVPMSEWKRNGLLWEPPQ